MSVFDLFSSPLRPDCAATQLAGLGFLVGGANNGGRGWFALVFDRAVPAFGSDGGRGWFVLVFDRAVPAFGSDGGRGW
ncbi:hypothetical protein [Lysobacter sp. CA199]|uniref:hypothetical protein n=1 Tax=Lysobacter sp. CA199 TaxID=3455608 RepID=UPI003F8D7B13